ncbi:MAG TPA: hypothetical protein VM370_00985 [Candidatus Thermoplasmatota archaeon]|nr:hypothetical protein [Candidatus Thermoplasmatota archaeon]
MRSRSLLLCLVLFGSSLAGCLKGGDGDVLAAGEGNETDFNKANPLENKTLLAFEETNATEAGSGGIDHPHDLWKGATRVVLFDTATMMDPGATATFAPPRGSLVYEGAASIEFTISNPERRGCEPFFTLDGDLICTDNAATYGGGPETPRAPDPTGGPAGLKLRYKHASTIDWIDVGDLVWGTPLTIKITDALQTDMPHATSSLWQFQVVSPNAYDGTLTFNAKAEQIRGDGEIPKWPGHPNFYADRTTREVLNIPDAAACESTSCALGGTSETDFVTADKLISYGTKTLHVWLNITEVQTANPATAPTNWFMFHYNATQRDNLTNPFDAEATAEKREFYWILPVDDNGMDSPYADGSRWTFKLGGSLTTPVISCYTGCADWFAKYSLVVHATNEELPFESYHYSCLRDEECPQPTA